MTSYGVTVRHGFPRTMTKDITAYRYSQQKRPSSLPLTRVHAKLVHTVRVASVHAHSPVDSLRGAILRVREALANIPWTLSHSAPCAACAVEASSWTRTSESMYPDPSLTCSGTFSCYQKGRACADWACTRQGAAEAHRDLSE